MLCAHLIQLTFTLAEFPKRAGEEDVCYLQDEMVKVKLTSSTLEVHVVPSSLLSFP